MGRNKRVHRKVIVASPPFCGADVVARRMSPNAVNGDKEPLALFQEKPGVFYVMEHAYMVHEFGGHVVYVFRDEKSALAEMLLAEYDADEVFGRIIKEVREMPELVNEEVLDHSNMVAYLYSLWPFQKKQMDLFSAFVDGYTYEEVPFTAESKGL